MLLWAEQHAPYTRFLQRPRLARVLLSNLYIVKPAIEKHILLYNNQQQRKHFSHFPPPSATYVRMYSPILKNGAKVFLILYCF